MNMTLEQRRDEILQAAIVLTNSGEHYKSLTRLQIAEAIGMVPSHVHRVFDTMHGFRQAVVKYAIAIEDSNTIIQALCVHDPLVRHLDKDIKERAHQEFLAN